MIRLFLCSLCAALLIASPVAAEPITTAIGLFVGASAAGAAAVGAFILRVVATIALTAIQRARMKKRQRKGAGLKRESTTTGDTTPQSIVIGRYATGGNAVCPAMSHGTYNGLDLGYLTYVIDLCDRPITSLLKIFVNGEEVVFDTQQAPVDAGYQASGKFAGKLWLKFHDGSQTEADPYLLSRYSTYPERPWRTDMVGKGVPYAIVTMARDSAVYSGFPQLRFELLGIPLYDPRKDSTVGGVGGHRWSDPSTWDYSDNAMVAAYNVLKGFDFDDGSWWGGRASFEQLPLAVWVAAMNACVPEAEGGGAPIDGGFRVGYELTLDEEPIDVLEKFMQAAGAEYVCVGGVWLVRVGPVAMPTYFFTDDDILRTQERELDPYPALKETFNAIHASYPEPAEGWEVKEAPAVYDEEFEAADAGSRLITDLDFEAVPYVRQVTYLMRAWLQDGRRFLKHSLTLPPDALRVNPLEAVSWTSQRHGYTAKIFEVDMVVTNGALLSKTLVIRERDAGDYVPVLDDDIIDVPAPIGVIEPSVPPIPGFDLVAFEIKDQGGIPRRPALKVQWDAAALGDPSGLEWLVQNAQQLTVASGLQHDLGDGEFVISSGILPNETYRATARVQTNLEGGWMDWVFATTANILPKLDDLADEVTQAIDTAQAAADLAAQDATQALLDAATVQDNLANAVASLSVDYTAVQIAAQAAEDAQLAAETAENSAAEHRGVVVSTAIDLLPSDFRDDDRYWSHALSGDPATKGGVTSAIGFRDVAGQGRVAWVTADLAETAHLAPKGYISPIQGRKYRMTIVARHLGPLGAGTHFGSQWRRFDENYGYVGYSYQPATFSAQDTWETFVSDYTMSGDDAAYLLAFPYFITSYQNPSAEIEIARVLIEDVTESAGAADAASAAANSASVAGASETEAGQSAAAAQTAKTAAETARAGAEVAQTTAATSASDAENAAASAATSATVAAQTIQNLNLTQTDFQRILSGVSSLDGNGSVETPVTGSGVLGQDGSVITETSAGIIDTAGSTNGARIRVPQEQALQFSGNRVRVDILAKPADSGAAAGFIAAYSTADNGNSGPQTFALQAGWKWYSFYYDVPAANGGGPDWIGLWGDSAKAGGKTQFARVLVRMAPLAADIPEIALVQASVTDEAIARATAVDALTSVLNSQQSQIDGISSSVTQQGTTLATIDGKVQAMTGLTATTVDVNGETRISGIQATSYANPDGSGGSLLKLIGDDVVAEGTLSANKLVVGLGKNLLGNTDFADGLQGWDNKGGLGSGREDASIGLRTAGSSWAGKYYPTLVVYQASAGTDGYLDITYRPPMVNGVVPAYGVSISDNVGWVEASVYASAHRCIVALRMEFRNHNGDVLSYTPVLATATALSDSGNPDKWPRLWGKAEVPTGAAYVTIHIRKMATNAGSNDSWMFLHKPQLVETTGAAIQPAPYSPQGSTLISNNRLATGAVTADKIDVNELSAVSANIGHFKSAPSGERVEIEDDRIRVFDSSDVARVVIGRLT
ncbi:phage tail protein [Tritonibacter mobilis]|uniref:hypothetical protein n=1 Tax=Tritonibacter mobilis TaxID=379347 RepID=UPI000806C36F|nr:hypothetical protein [Tritonibacter mobilis]